MSHTKHLLAAVTTACLAACAATPPAALPATLAPPANESLAIVVPARGVQIYECRGGAAGPRWAFIAPEAELFDTHGNPIGRHGAGPFWQARDGSRIVGTLRQRIDAPVAGAIPWLLLAAQAEGHEGAFSRITSIQRINTVGGTAPPEGCAPEHIGQQARVAYRADYHFYSNPLAAR